MSIRWFGLGRRRIEMVGCAHKERAGADDRRPRRRRPAGPVVDAAGTMSSGLEDLHCDRWIGRLASATGHRDRSSGSSGRAVSGSPPPVRRSAGIAPAPAVYSAGRAADESRATAGRSAYTRPVIRPVTPTRGWFITLEGPEGAGKTTQADGSRRPPRRPGAATSSSPASPAGRGSVNGSATSSWRGPDRPPRPTRSPMRCCSMRPGGSS